MSAYMVQTLARMKLGGIIQEDTYTVNNSHFFSTLFIINNQIITILSFYRYPRHSLLENNDNEHNII